jgi:4-amino-4-deoxy-L-arabinose transferase-like glycosyltransferase
MTHRTRGALIATTAGLALALLAFFPRAMDAGVAVGVALVIVFIAGLLDSFGAFSIEPCPAGWSGPPLAPGPSKSAELPARLAAAFEIRTLWVGLGLFVAGLCRLAVLDTPAAAAPWSGPALLLGAALCLVTARLLRRRGTGGLHPGLFLLCLSAGLVLATLGSHGLWDCWETHYGEVARRQLEQDDWIGLWWQDEWFFSKPILIFWMMNLGLALFGVDVRPDSIPAHAEWGLRFLVAVLAIAVVLGVYSLLARRVSRRAGLFAALVLLTMPLWAFMTRQAITDLPFVGLMTLAVVLFLAGVTADPDAEVRPLLRLPLGRGRCLPLTGFHAVIAGWAAVGVPQMILLSTRSAAFRQGTLARGDLKTVASAVSLTDVHLSDFLPSALGVRLGGHVDLSLDWLLLGLACLVPFLLLLRSLRGERRVSRLCFAGMYLMLALSVMAKGLPGLVMPILGLAGLWIHLAPWRRTAGRGARGFLGWHVEMLRRLDAARGAGLFLLVASPWYVAMVFRHGSQFFNRFFIHDHFKRLSVGVHGDNGTVEYYVQQLGYAAFPWVALLPFAILALVRWSAGGAAAEGTDPAARTQRLIRIFCASWFVLSLAFLSLMVTKFHHYVFPLLPAAAILIGLLIDDAWSGRLRRLGPVVLCGLVILAVVARDLAVSPAKGAGVLAGHAQLLGLFIYKYSRPYPAGPEYDFGPSLIAFSALFGLLLLGWLGTRWRRAAIALTLVAALGFEFWLAQRYMVGLAPHWTQRHLVEEYYARRTSPAERLVAFQMNWKGENFYTGNRVLVYVSTKNKEFEKWLDRHRGERHFFVTEHHRFERMSERAKAASGPLEPLADTCNKYRAGVAEEL